MGASLRMYQATYPPGARSVPAQGRVPLACPTKEVVSVKHDHARRMLHAGPGQPLVLIARLIAGLSSKLATRVRFLFGAGIPAAFLPSAHHLGRTDLS